MREARPTTLCEPAGTARGRPVTTPVMRETEKPRVAPTVLLARFEFHRATVGSGMVARRTGDHRQVGDEFVHALALERR